MDKCFYILFFFMVINQFANAGSTPDKAFTAGVIIESVKYGSENGEEKDNHGFYCSNFKLNEKQMNAFFNEAKIINKQKLEDEYYHSVCMVEGIINTCNKRAKFMIMATLTGQLIYEDGSKVLLGCDDKCTRELAGLEATEENDGEPSFMWNTGHCYSDMKKKWAQDDRDKQKNSGLFRVIEEKYRKTENTGVVITEAEEVSFNDLRKKNMPDPDQWKTLSGGIDYKYFEIIPLTGKTIYSARTEGDGGSGTHDFYVKNKDGFKRIMRLKFTYYKIYIIKMKNDGPEFIGMKTGYGGSGWNGDLFVCDKDYNLKSVLKIGGWRADTCYLNLNGSGALVVANAACTGVAEAAKEYIEKCPGYRTGVKMGPQMMHVDVNRWNGNKFESMGKFYIGDDEITSNY